MHLVFLWFQYYGRSRALQKVTRVQLFCVEVKIRNQHQKENIFSGFVDILLVMPKTSQIKKKSAIFRVCGYFWVELKIEKYALKRESVHLCRLPCLRILPQLPHEKLCCHLYTSIYQQNHIITNSFPTLNVIFQHQHPMTVYLILCLKLI